MEHYLKIIDYLRNILISWGVSPYLSNIFKVSIVIVAILVLAWIANFIAKRIILTVLHTLVKKSKTDWDDIIYERRVF
ncbi:MAG: hypothetical protein HC830_07965 [Bacteroidetes bacterium]|nr:hypothetical protein [Bacteroidota bacterium]